MPSRKKFQSTLPHGERHSLSHKFIGHLCFNPRSHMGSDAGYGQVTADSGVSIHAPTWGATQFISCIESTTRFNPRSHMGSDRGQVSAYFGSRSFNPRSHMGSDVLFLLLSLLLVSFNPRSHMGSDTKTGNNSPSLAVSIHAPTWGATFYYLR